MLETGRRSISREKGRHGCINGKNKYNASCDLVRDVCICDDVLRLQPLETEAAGKKQTRVQNVADGTRGTSCLTTAI